MIPVFLQHLRRTLLRAGKSAVRHGERRNPATARDVSSEDRPRVQELSRAAVLIACRISAARLAQASKH